MSDVPTREQALAHAARLLLRAERAHETDLKTSYTEMAHCWIDMTAAMEPHADTETG